MRVPTTVRIGSRKHVPIQTRWGDNRKWHQLVVEDECDAVVARFFASAGASARGLVLGPDA
jgi:hypothetical protein